MKEIKFQETQEWLFNNNKKKINSLKKDAEKRIDKIKKTIDEIKSACYFLSEHADQTADGQKDIGIKSAKRFSEKVIEKVNELEYPSKENINCDILVNFKMKFERVLRSDFYDQIGRRFVRKLDKQFRQDISEINYLLKDASHQFMDLQEFIEKKYKKIKTIEDSFEKISKVEQMLSDLSNIKSEKRDLETKLDTLNTELKAKEEKKEELEKDNRFENLKKTKKEIEQISQKILDVFAPFRKSLKKYSKFARLDGLESYVLDPVDAFLKDTETTEQFNIILTNLKQAIETGELKLKTSDERKTLKKIEEFSSRSKLGELRIQFNEKMDQKKKLQENLNNSGLYKKFEDFERRIAELDREKKEIEVSLNKNLEDNDRILENIANNISTLEELIFRAENNQIKIIME
ncbi:MAG: hypothetical protein EAX96_05450 [Candidatus Lokiarchaeota archaeon]|nr:hypothetical protein [Candidatus Lokiarchaeota archaeon]